MARNQNQNEISITRIYDAPVDAVWNAWTDPEQVAHWWGPRGFTITTHSKDLRPGGQWHYTMHGPDGVNYPNRTMYFEVEEHSKLVYDHGAAEDQPPLFRVTVLFSKSGNKTKMEMTMAFSSPESREQALKNIKAHSGNATWDRLAEYLAQKLSGKNQFVINQSFNSPIQLMYLMWTSPEHFAKWMGPKDTSMEVLRADVRPGGSLFYCVTSSSGEKMFGRANYLELIQPSLLVYNQEFVDQDENSASHPMAPIWPKLMRTMVNFTEEDSQRTRVTLIWEPHGAVLQDELNTFISARPGMTSGWAGTFDKLEECLSEKHS
jgi:uncharacterized protein YndB with AHSA1/START domain